MDTRDRQIIAQTAGKIAAELMAQHSMDFQQFPVVLGLVNDSLIEAAGTTPATGNQVPQPPGNQVPQPAPEGNYQAAVGNLQAAGISVSPVPGPDSSDEEWWQYFVANRTEFWDNRDRDNVTIKGGNSPDFRAKNLVDKTGKPKGLFLVSRRFGSTAPDYVFEALGVPKPSLAAGAQTQPTVVAAPAGAPQSAPF